MVQTTVPVLLDKEQNDCFKAQTEAQSSTDKQKKNQEHYEDFCKRGIQELSNLTEFLLRIS